jgi:hypothetical protein
MTADPPGFQASASLQGRQFAQQCIQLLSSSGYALEGALRLPDIGVEIDQVALSPRGTRVWFEFKGSIQGNRPGLRRTDTLKKAIANGALVRMRPEHAMYVVLTSHLPIAGSGLAMLEMALSAGYLSDVICLYDPTDARRLREI